MRLTSPNNGHSGRTGDFRTMLARPSRQQEKGPEEKKDRERPEERGETGDRTFQGALTIRNYGERERNRR